MTKAIPRLQTAIQVRRNDGDAASHASTCSSIAPAPGASHVSSYSQQGQQVHVDESMSTAPAHTNIDQGSNTTNARQDHDDRYNYALLIALYTLQGIPMGLSASIPFLIQQKIKLLAASTAATAATSTDAARLSYNANAIFALCSWPFSLKLLWAPVVDSIFFKPFGRRKSWLVPAQTLAGLMMVGGSDFVERQLGLEALPSLFSDSTASAVAAESELAHPIMAAAAQAMNVKGLTAFFFVLYFLMATQDIAVDGWALTMLSKKNRGRGPVCNSIGQNLGYFLSFVGFLALNDAESSENLWRPLFGLPSLPGKGIVTLGGFIKFMGVFMLVITTLVALFKHEGSSPETNKMAGPVMEAMLSSDYSDNIKKGDNNRELDASEIGLRETYHRLWAVCQLPAVQWLFLILLTYRLPTALSDNVKFLKAVEFGLSKSTTALLSPTLILPLGILVPILAARTWHGHPLRQFVLAYRARLTLVPCLDMLMLHMVRRQQQQQHHDSSSSWSPSGIFWMTIVASTGLQAIVSSLQANAQMTFFAHRVDPAIGGSYMTLLNTAANLGGTWPASFVMYLVGRLTVPPECNIDRDSGLEVCAGGRDAYFPLQIALSGLGLAWIAWLGKRVQHVADLPDEAWRTHLLDEDTTSMSDEDNDMEMGWNRKDDGKRE
jgi:PAT family acetyl-CoA transporter-like MFS transporter 1